MWEGRPTSLLLVGQILRTVVFLMMLAALGLAVQHYLLPSVPNPPPALATIMLSVLALLVLLTFGRLFQAWLKVKTIKWVLTNQRLVVEGGVISRTLDNVDVRTIDDTKFQQPIAGRILGFGTVIVISKDKTHPILELPGGKQPRQIQELIRATAYKMSQGQVFMREA